MATMTRKHYVAFANELGARMRDVYRAHGGETSELRDAFDRAQEAMCAVFIADNPRFEAQRFYDAVQHVAYGGDFLRVGQRFDSEPNPEPQQTDTGNLWREDESK